MKPFMFQLSYNLILTIPQKHKTGMEGGATFIPSVKPAITLTSNGV